MAWMGLISPLLMLDYYRWHKHDQSTLSDGFRYLFHTNTRQGKAAFLVSLYLFYRHIMSDK